VDVLDEFDDRIIHFDVLYLCTDIVLVLLEDLDHLLDEIFVCPHETRKTLLQSCDVVHGIDQFIVAVVVGVLPATVLGGL
jgi:hypothetical protein